MIDNDTKIDELLNGGWEGTGIFVFQSVDRSVTHMPSDRVATS